MVLRLEILQRGCGLQASEPSEYLVDRRRGPRLVRVLYGVPVDAEWKFTGIHKKVPRSQSFGISESYTSAI